MAAEGAASAEETAEEEAPAEGAASAEETAEEAPAEGGASAEGAAEEHDADAGFQLRETTHVQFSEVARLGLLRTVLRGGFRRSLGVQEIFRRLEGVSEAFSHTDSQVCTPSSSEL